MVRSAKPSASTIAALVSCSLQRRSSIRHSKDLLSLVGNYSLCINQDDFLEYFIEKINAGRDNDTSSPGLASLDTHL